MRIHKRHRPHSIAERLEARVAPAGLVTATFAAGVLTLTGDAEANFVSVSQSTPDSFQLQGASGTTIALNGAPAETSISFTGTMLDIIAKMGGGDDTLNIPGVTVQDDVVFEGEGGEDLLSLNATYVLGDLTMLGGTGLDRLSGSGTSIYVRGSLLADMGDGENVVDFNAAATTFDGPVTILGGTDADAVSFSGFATKFAKTLTAKLGAGNNALTVAGGDALIGGAVVVENLDHTGSVLTQFVPNSAFTANGTITVTNGAGDSATIFGGGARGYVKGLIKVTTQGGADSVTFGASIVATAAGGMNLALGDGANNFTVSGAATIGGTLTVTGGSGNDVLILSPSLLRVGTATLSLGDGSNSLSVNGPDAAFTGLLSLTTATGDDTFSVTSTRALFTKGIQYFAGSGVNVMSVTGHSFTSGAITTEYGDHSAGQSVVSIAPFYQSVTGSIKITTAAGDDLVTLNSASAAYPAVTVATGDGVNVFNIGSGIGTMGAVSYTGGAGEDTVTMSNGDVTLASLKIVLGEGGNAFTNGGQQTVITGTTTLTGGGEVDSVNFTPNVLTFGKKATFTMNGGADTITINTVGIFTAGSTVAATFGAHAAGTSTFNVFATRADVKGLVSATFVDGTNTMSVSANGGSYTGGVKMTGGAGVDNLGVGMSGGNSVLGPITFAGGEGANTAGINVAGGKIGAILLTGGSAVDIADIVTVHTTIASVKAETGAGADRLTINGGPSSTITGALTAIAKNTASEAYTFSVFGLTVKGATSVTTGDGADIISGNTNASSFLGALTIKTGSGADLISFARIGNGPSLFRSAVNIVMGDGDDSLEIGSNGFVYGRFFSSVKIDGGIGTDTARVSTPNFSNIYPLGQPVIVGVEVSS
jgi:hypothetical protein